MRPEEGDSHPEVIIMVNVVACAAQLGTTLSNWVAERILGHCHRDSKVAEETLNARHEPRPYLACLVQI
jgi:hypothetical protein